uniref:Calcineurin B homologous protein 3 n=1 Tax=Poecilia reticulata TaxID=8081 RepID=A0A3P9PBA0_POERE
MIALIPVEYILGCVVPLTTPQVREAERGEREPLATMGALTSTPAPIEHADLSEKTGFSHRQIMVLHKRFKHLSDGDDVLRREDFLGIPSLKYNPIRKEIIEAFFNRRNFSPSRQGRANEIGFEEFLVVLSYFRPPCSKMTDEQRKNIRREKLKFIFNMHDADGDGLITLEDYKHVVEELLSRSGALGKETSRAIADAAMFEVARTVGHTITGILMDKPGELQSPMQVIAALLVSGGCHGFS